MEKNLGHATAYGYAKSKGYSGTEEEFAQLMADYASVGQSAAQSAEQAAASATSASGSAATATQAAQTATTKASDAIIAEGVATAKAEDAQAYATSANQSAESASTSAQTATTAATTATTKASEASESATTATAAKTDAESARDAAAQSASEAAASAASIDPDEFNHKIYAAFATDTATGSIASFADGADNIPLKSCIVQVNPVQDLHGYESPWPAGGGVNKINFANCIAGKAAFGLTSAISGEYFRFTGTCSSGGDHTWVFGTVNSEQQSVAENINFKGFVISGGSALVITEIAYISSNSALSVNLSGLVTNQTYDFILGIVAYEGSTAPTVWSPYSNICPISGWTGCEVKHSGADTSNPTTYPITFPTEAGTVYGGTLDVTKGELVVDRVVLTYNTANMSNSEDYPGWKDAKVADIAGTGINATMPEIVTNVGIGVGVNTIVFPGVIFLPKQLHNNLTQSDWKALAIDIQIVLLLATPITYQLTPQEITSLLGTNNVWADTGDSEVEYRADTKLYITKKITEAVSALS